MVNEYLFRKILGKLNLPHTEESRVVHQPFGKNECFIVLHSYGFRGITTMQITCYEDKTHLTGLITESKPSWFFAPQHEIGSWNYKKKTKILEISLRGQVYIETLDK